MTEEQLTHGLQKSLEVWALQSLCDMAILAGFAALALMAARAYLERLKSRLTLRVGQEILEGMGGLGVDVLLAGVALVALLVVNMDIMADIKIGLPWVPLGFVLMTMALVIRLCHGGHAVGSKAWFLALALVGAGALSNWFGYTFVMEGAGDEYLSLHPSAGGFWNAMKQMRSNKNPDLAMATFVWASPLLVGTLAWAVVAGAVRSLRWTRQHNQQPADPSARTEPADAR